MTITEPVEDQTTSAKRGSRRPLLIAGLGVTVAVGALVYAVGWTSLMGINAIEVEGNRTVRPDVLIAAAGIEKGTPMMGVDVRAATARLADLPQLASVDVRRNWPRTVVLVVTERQPVAAQREASGWQLLDGNGVAFALSPQRPKDLPTVERSPVEATNTAMLHALAGMSEPVRSQVALISATSEDAIRLKLRKSGAIVNWGSADLSDYKSGVLEILLTTRAGWYDVSNPDRPATADAPPAPLAGPGATPVPNMSPGPSATPSLSASPVPTAAAPSEAPTPAGAETPVGVVPQSD
ncbi:MAG TPA: FtsQ-type POTRA domain-containing protein [Actinomycetota bacterium]|nr:FtsQ-type POTRA domain-containing protein [Actinomycetota bacterium]